MTSTNPVSTALCRCLRWWILYSVHNHNDVNQPCLQCTLQVYSLVDSVHTALNSTQRTCSKGASLLKWFYPLIYRNYIFPMWAEIIFYNFLNFFLFPFVKSFRCKRFIQTACLDVHPPPLQPLSSTHSTFKDNPWPNVPGIIPELTTPPQSTHTIVFLYLRFIMKMNVSLDYQAPGSKLNFHFHIFRSFSNIHSLVNE